MSDTPKARSFQSWWGLVLAFAAGIILGVIFGPVVFREPFWPARQGDGETSSADQQIRPPSGEKIRQAFARPVGKLPFGADGLNVSQIQDYLAKQPGLPGPLELRLEYHVIRILKGDQGQPSRWFGHYQYSVRYQHGGRDKNVPVAKASRALMVVASDPILVRDRNIPTNALELGAPEATVPAAVAVRLAAGRSPAVTAAPAGDKAAPSSPEAEGAESHQLVVWVDSDGIGQFAWEILLRSSDPRSPVQRRSWVAARGEPRVLDYEDLGYAAREPDRPGRGNRPAFLRAAEARPAAPPAGRAAVRAEAGGGTRGKVTGSVWATNSFGKVETRALSRIDVILRQAGKADVRVPTNDKGEYLAPTVNGNVHVSAELAGRFGRILNDQQGDVLLTVGKNGQGSVDLDFGVKDNDTLNLARVTAFCRINEARDFAAEFLPATITKLNRIEVSVHNQALFQPSADYSDIRYLLKFDRGKDVYPNRVARDVVIHEYGHALDHEWGSVRDRPYTEGFSDSLVILMTGSPVFGEDYEGKGTKLRDATEPVTWDDVKEEPEGNIGDYKRAGVYSGFVWDLLAQLEKQFAAEPNPKEAAYRVGKQLILGAASSDPKNVEEAVRLSFIYDAEQYRRGPGKTSKHYDSLEAAAKKRKLPLPPNPLDPKEGLVRD